MSDKLLLQEVHSNSPWKMMVCCILLNQTNRRQVDRVIDELFARWPYSSIMAGIESKSETQELVDVLRPLGFQRRRATTLIRFSRDWCQGKLMAECYGIGPYALDSFRIFYLRDYSRFESGDKEIAAWLDRNVAA